MLQKSAPHRVDGDVNIFCPLVKVDAAKREVWGVVTAEVPDKDNEICDYETTVPYYKEVVDEMSKATDGANIFPLRSMHGLIAAGKGISIEFRKEAKEVFMGFKVVDDTEWKKVEEGVYTGFSQGGRYVKRWKDGDYVRYTAKPGEVSLVDLPCLTRAHFEYVKADGTKELRKFAKAEACDCSCKECKDGNCAGCTVEGCDCGKTSGAKPIPSRKVTVAYIVDDKPVPRLMMQAWKVLENDKNKVADFRKLKQVYAKEGLETPVEKAERIQPALEEMLKDVIQQRAYGRLGKGMYTVANFAQILDNLKYLWMSMEYERENEGDESPATDDVKATVADLLDAFLAYTEEQVEEERALQASSKR